MKICEVCCGLDKENCPSCNPQLSKPNNHSFSLKKSLDQHKQNTNTELQCQNCGNLLPHDAVLCTNCGTFVNGQKLQASSSKSPRKKVQVKFDKAFILPAAIALFFLSIIGIGFYYTQKAPEKVNDSLEISFHGFEESLQSSYNQRAMTKKLESELKSLTKTLKLDNSSNIRFELQFKKPEETSKRGKYIRFTNSSLRVTTILSVDYKEVLRSTKTVSAPNSINIPAMDTVNNALATACFKNFLKYEWPENITQIQRQFEMLAYASGENTDYSQITSDYLYQFYNSFNVDSTYNPKVLEEKSLKFLRKCNEEFLLFLAQHKATQPETRSDLLGGATQIWQILISKTGNKYDKEILKFIEPLDTKNQFKSYGLVKARIDHGEYAQFLTEYMGDNYDKLNNLLQLNMINNKSADMKTYLKHIITKIYPKVSKQDKEQLLYTLLGLSTKNTEYYPEIFLAQDFTKEDNILFFKTFIYPNERSDVVYKFLSNIEEKELRHEYILSLRAWKEYRELLKIEQNFTFNPQNFAIFDAYGAPYHIPIFDKKGQIVLSTEYYIEGLPAQVKCFIKNKDTGAITEKLRSVKIVPNLDKDEDKFTMSLEAKIQLKENEETIPIQQVDNYTGIMYDLVVEHDLTFGLNNTYVYSNKYRSTLHTKKQDSTFNPISQRRIFLTDDGKFIREDINRLYYRDSKERSYTKSLNKNKLLEYHPSQYIEDPAFRSNELRSIAGDLNRTNSVTACLKLASYYDLNNKTKETQLLLDKLYDSTSFISEFSSKKYDETSFNKLAKLSKKYGYEEQFNQLIINSFHNPNHKFNKDLYLALLKKHEPNHTLWKTIRDRVTQELLGSQIKDASLVLYEIYFREDRLNEAYELIKKAHETNSKAKNKIRFYYADAPKIENVRGYYSANEIPYLIQFCKVHNYKEHLASLRVWEMADKITKSKKWHYGRKSLYTSQKMTEVLPEIKTDPKILSSVIQQFHIDKYQVWDVEKYLSIREYVKAQEKDYMSIQSNINKALQNNGRKRHGYFGRAMKEVFKVRPELAKSKAFIHFIRDEIIKDWENPKQYLRYYPEVIANSFKESLITKK